MVKAKVDALVPTLEASYVQEHGSLSILPARYRTGAYKRAFLTHRNDVTTAVKRVAGASCATEAEKREVLQADLERNVSLCLHNSFSGTRSKG